MCSEHHSLLKGSLPQGSESVNEVTLKNPVIEAIFRDDWRAALAFTVTQLFELGSGQTVTAGELAEMMGLIASKHGNYTWANRALQNPIFTPKPIMTRRQGRPKLTYVIPTIQQIATYYDVDLSDYHSHTTFRAEDCVSREAFGMRLHVDLIKRRPGQYSRRWQAERLGIGESTLRRWEKKIREKIGLIVKPMIREVQRVTRRIVRQIARHLPEDGAPGRRYLSLRIPKERPVDGRLQYVPAEAEREVKRRSLSRINVYMALKEGYDVFVVERDTNWYGLKAPPEPR